MNRIGFLGGTDAKRIMDGDWKNLYLEKIGELEPQDLSGVFMVQLGKYTEQFHADWLATYHDLELQILDGPMRHLQYPFLHANPDRWLPQRNTFLDLKHSHERASPRMATEQHLAQMAHYCMCIGTDVCFLSTIPGNDEPFITKIEPPRQYMEELLDHELRFWWHVENKVMPDIVPAASLAETGKLAKLAKVDGMRFVDMTSNNEWANAAGMLIETKTAHGMHEEAKAALKGLMVADIGEATGHGVTIKRDRRGALRITMEGGE